MFNNLKVKMQTSISKYNMLKVYALEEADTLKNEIAFDCEGMYSEKLFTSGQLNLAKSKAPSASKFAPKPTDEEVALGMRVKPT